MGVSQKEKSCLWDFSSDILSLFPYRRRPEKDKGAMKEMKEWKRGFAGGVAASVLCASLLGTAFAANYQKQATLDYTGIKRRDGDA